MDSPSTELKPDLEDIEEMMRRETEGTYTTPEARAAYRAGMSTAVAVCDCHAKLYASGKKSGLTCEDAASSCGTDIWQLRSMISVPFNEGASTNE